MINSRNSGNSENARFVMHANGVVGCEQRFGNRRFDLTGAGGPTLIIGEHGTKGCSTRTVIRPGGHIAQEWEMGNMRFSTDRNGLDFLM